MEATNYIIECNNLLMEEIENDHIHMINVMESEFDFIMNCMENNYISTEAVASVESTENKQGKFKRIIEIIKNLIAKFIAKVKELVQSLDTWKKENFAILDKITSYDGLKMKALPYWEADNELAVSKINAMIAKFNAVRDNPEVTYPEDAVEIVKTVTPFKEFYADGVGFTQACKTVFSFNTAVDISKAEKYEGVEITTSSDIQTKVKIMRSYIDGYSNYANKLKGLSDNFSAQLKKAEQDFMRKPTKESSIYLNLEEAYIGETELRFCRNYHTLFEADENKTENKSEEQKTNTVVSTETPEDKKEGNDDSNSSNKNYLKYKMALAQLTMSAIAAAITVAETKLISYKKLITQIIIAKKGSIKKEKEPDKKEETKPDANQEK